MARASTERVEEPIRTTTYRSLETSVEYVAASILAVLLTSFAVLKPRLYGEHLFKAIYYLVVAGLAVALATVYVRDGVVSHHLVYALAGLGLVAVVLLPVSGKISGRW